MDVHERDLEGWHPKMGDHGILLGRRHMLYYRSQSVTLLGWQFHITRGFTVIAECTKQSANNLISIYRDAEKMARLRLTERRKGAILVVEAVASDIKLEVIPWARLVFLTEKRDGEPIRRDNR